MTRAHKILRGSLAAVLALCLSACSVAHHYELLSFFFNDVPKPANLASQTGELTIPTEERARQLMEYGAEMAERQAHLDRTSRRYFHKPFQERRCTDCHKRRQSATNRAGWSLGISALKTPKKQLCLTCHERPSAKFVHGPTDTGRCDLCHEHHSSQFPHLLRVEDPDRLCVSCHQGESFPTRKRHKEASYAQKKCIACHDPHGASQKWLLRPKSDWDKPSEYDEDPNAEAARYFLYYKKLSIPRLVGSQDHE